MSLNIVRGSAIIVWSGRSSDMFVGVPQLVSKLALIVEVDVVSGQRPAFLARTREHATACLREEPGCLRFDVLVPEDQAEAIVLYEVYADRAALEAHRATDRIVRYFDDVNGMIERRKRTLCVIDGTS